MSHAKQTQSISNPCISNSVAISSRKYEERISSELFKNQLGADISFLTSIPKGAYSGDIDHPIPI
jgi:hypothetical protein